MNISVARALRGNKNGCRWEVLLGYTVGDLRKHLESRFTIGMTWINMGGWHIDHIVPKSRFNYNKPEDPEFKVCWGLANLQPLWGTDNSSKKNKTMDEWIQYKKAQ